MTGQENNKAGKVNPSMSVSWIYRSNGLIFMILVLGSLLVERPGVTLGVMTGGILSIINFVALAKIGSTLSRPGINAMTLSLKVFLKFLLLGAAIAAVMFLLPIEPLSFVIGISVTVFSIIIGGMLHAFSIPSVKPESTDA